MKVIYVEPGTSVIQAFSNAYYAVGSKKPEPITVCANGVRAIFMADDNSDEIEAIEPPQLVNIEVYPNIVCTKKEKCPRYDPAVSSICNTSSFEGCYLFHKVDSSVQTDGEKKP